MEGLLGYIFLIISFICCLNSSSLLYFAIISSMTSKISSNLALFSF
ncbi:hypothetical protein [Campylobacter lanienae]|nr:hypothetical protein [Campylobacter lanienae]